MADNLNKNKNEEAANKEKKYVINGHEYTQSQIEKEIEEDILNIFHNLVPEPYIGEIRLYQNPEKNGKINILLQYGTNPMEGSWREDDLFNAIAEEQIIFNGLEVDVNPITPEKSGTIEEYLERLETLGAESEAEAIKKQAEMLDEKEENHKPRIFSFEPFGYEGAVVEIETDLRRGIPAYDIAGMADSAVKETRERIRAAFANSGLEMPPERILQALSPADLRKDGSIETVAMAVAILNEKEPYNSDDILILGDLELSGNIRPVRSIHAAVASAKERGISKVIVPELNKTEALGVDGVEVLGVSSLSDINEKLRNNVEFEKNVDSKITTELTVEFNEEAINEILDMNLDGYYDTARAIEIAIAGKHNILLSGEHGCGKTLLTQRLMPALTPKLTKIEAQTTTRIHSLAGLMKPNEGLRMDSPFRMPYKTATIEGFYGGGSNCSPGEISLAHNGTLFLDEAAEFRSSVLEMLRVPLESGQIILSRAGRSTVYPASFQLAMATNPCPCGCYGSNDRLCLCSARFIKNHWNKFGSIIDRVEIKQTVQKNDKDNRRISVIEMKKHIENAIRIQRENEHYNSKLSAYESAEKCHLNEECQKYFDKVKDNYSLRSQSNMLKVALTIANMDNRREIALNDLKESVELVSPIFEKPNQFKKDINTTEYRKEIVDFADLAAYCKSVNITADKIRSFCGSEKGSALSEREQKALLNACDRMDEIKKAEGLALQKNANTRKVWSIGF